MNLVKELSQHFHITQHAVRAFLLRAPNKYKVYFIPKRNGGRRTIAQPSKDLKTYQRAFLELYSFPVHPCSMAYVKNTSIKDNATKHKDNNYLLKMDFENFFNSITPAILIETWAKQNVHLDPLDRHYLIKLLFWCPSKRAAGKHILSVGAPSSPYISNTVMYTFDELLQSICKTKRIVYTRYADDMTFSTMKKDILFEIPKIVEQCLQSHFGNRLSINIQKTVFSSKAHNRHVTGITLDNNSNLSLGRKKKRYIKHLIHQYTLAKMDEGDLLHIRGLLAHAKHIEPSFIRSLEKKYSSEIMRNLVKGQKNEY